MANSPIFPWQQGSWKQLAKMRATLPHALLFHGTAGIGKTHFAEQFAQALLCEDPTENGYACCGCASCGWFIQYSHPDFRRVRPEALENDEPESGDETDSSETGKNAKGSKNPSKEIKIDQIRALTDFMNISTHRQGMRVVTLYPAEALNAAAANALLKTLEEPPPSTVFILIANSVDRLLPTILSRCRKFAFPVPPREETLAWLAKENIENAEAWLAEQGGAPLAALAAVNSDLRQSKEEFLRLLARPNADGALVIAERMQKLPVTELVVWLQRWLYDALSVKLCGRTRYYPGYRRELAAMTERVDTRSLLAALRSINERRMISEHPLSAKLFIEDMMLEYSILFT